MSEPLDNSDENNRDRGPEPPNPFLLRDLRPGKLDKMHNKIIEIFWSVSDYAIYRTKRGVFVHFSDDPGKEADQRCRFAKISPELCELRYLTSEMHGWRRPKWLRIGKATKPDESLFDHNIAMAIMLAIEEEADDSAGIVKAALVMAVGRVTNDNTIRYVATSIVAALAAMALAWIVARYIPGELHHYVTAGLFGTFGAVFSIITRVQAFEMKPCQQSNMNYWMAGIRVVIGLMGGFMLYLIAQQTAARNLFNPDLFGSNALQVWQGAALIGFLGGFAERLVRTIFKRTADAFESSGTPVQLARMRAGARSNPAPGPP